MPTTACKCPRPACTTLRHAKSPPEAKHALAQPHSAAHHTSRMPGHWATHASALHRGRSPRRRRPSDRRRPPRRHRRRPHRRPQHLAAANAPAERASGWVSCETRACGGASAAPPSPGGAALRTRASAAAAGGGAATARPAAVAAPVSPRHAAAPQPWRHTSKQGAEGSAWGAVAAEGAVRRHCRAMARRPCPNRCTTLAARESSEVPPHGRVEQGFVVTRRARLMCDGPGEHAWLARGWRPAFARLPNRECAGFGADYFMLVSTSTSRIARRYGESSRRRLVCESTASSSADAPALLSPVANQMPSSASSSAPPVNELAPTPAAGPETRRHHERQTKASTGPTRTATYQHEAARRLQQHRHCRPGASPPDPGTHPVPRTAPTLLLVHLSPRGAPRALGATCPAPQRRQTRI